jgi:RNA polymerase sigma-70 factor (ECF subfamily)
MSRPLDGWLADFHAGDRTVLERCYRDHYDGLIRVVSRLLRGADAETVTHEVFYRLLYNAKMRESFHGGNLEAWLHQVATNLARDHLRRYKREEPERLHAGPRAGDDGAGEMTDEVEAKMLIERFRREHLPAEWAGVFDARFLRQLSQRDAASELGLPRTTLVYQEQRIRASLQDFLLRGDGS